MATTKSDRIASIEEQIAQLENRRKQLIQAQREQDRKNRTKRLIERGAILEGMIEGADALTNDQIKAFLQKTITTPYAAKSLDGVKAQSGTIAVSRPENAQRQHNGANVGTSNDMARRAG